MSTQVAKNTTYIMVEREGGEWYWELYYLGDIVGCSLPKTWKDVDYRHGTHDAYINKQRFLAKKQAEVRNGN